MKRIFLVVCAFVITAGLLLAGCGNKDSAQGSAGSVASAQGQLTVKVLDVGQGDAILIRTGAQTVLIDTGDAKFYEDGKKGQENNLLMAALQKENVTVIDKLILTHAHADHIGRAPDVVEQLNVKEIIYNGIPSTNKYFRQTLKNAKDKGVQLTKVTAGTTVDLGNNVKFEVISPDEALVNKDSKILTDADKKNDKQAEANNESVVGILSFGSFKMMLTGDAEKEIEAGLVQKYGKSLECQVLKAGHHGSKTSSSEAFLKAVKPKAALISAGANNQYHNPHPSTMKMYSALGIMPYCTIEKGTITVTSDGKNFEITSEK